MNYFKIQPNLNLRDDLMNIFKSSFLFPIAFILSAPQSADAAQRLYKETPDGWFIYVEERSCVVYFDYEGPSGSEMMIRFSARTDQNRLYFSIVSSGWDSLAADIGNGANIYLAFPGWPEAFVSAGMTIRNPDGRMGYAADGFTIEEVGRAASSSGVMEVGVRAGDAPNYQKVSEVPISGAAVAWMHLDQCTAINFPTGLRK